MIDSIDDLNTVIKTERECRVTVSDWDDHDVFLCM